MGLIVIACSGIGLTSCAPDYETKFNVEKLEVPYKSQGIINFTIEGGSKDIKVETNLTPEKWSARSNAEWCQVEKHAAKVTVSAGVNDSYINRVARITVAYGHQSYDIGVTQRGKESILLVEGKQQGVVKQITALDESLSVRVSTDLDLDHILIPDTVHWLQVVSVEPSESEMEKIVTFKTEQNISSNPRYGKVILQSSQDYERVASFVIAQKAKFAFRDILLTPEMLSTNAQETKEGDIKNLIDGEAGTYFHSAWSFSVNEAHYFQIKLVKPITGCKFWYQNRNNNNGKPVEVAITVSADGTTWTSLDNITSGLPTGGASQYQSKDYFTPVAFEYFRFTVNKTNDKVAPTFFNMAEFKIYEIYDL